MTVMNDRLEARGFNFAMDIENGLYEGYQLISRQSLVPRDALSLNAIQTKGSSSFAVRAAAN